MITPFIQRTGAKVLAGLAISIVSILLFGWIAEEMLENDTARFDNAVRGIVHKRTPTGVTEAMKLASDIGSPLAGGTLTFVIITLAWLRGYRRQALLLAIAMTGAVILDTCLKLAFHRVRPVPYFNLPAPASFSFPSGHAMISFCFYGSLAYVITEQLQVPARRIAVWVAAALLVLWIGLSRIYLGVHYPSDVVAGFTAGAFWLSSVFLAEHDLRRRFARRQP